MTRALQLAFLFAKVSIQNLTAYRFDLSARLIMAVLHLVGEIAVVWTIFTNTESVNGWGSQHMLVLVGVYRIVAGGIRIFIVPNMRKVLEDIREGTLDFVLLRPVNAQLLVSIREFVVWRAADVILGASLALYGCYHLNDALPTAPIAQFVVTLVAAFAIVYSVWLMLATLCFWFIRVQNIEMVFWNVFEAGRFPIVIYRSWGQWLLTFLVPLAFITTVPAVTLVGDPDLMAGSAVFIRGLPLVALALAAVLLLVSAWFWRFGLRHYAGASA